MMHQPRFQSNKLWLRILAMWALWVALIATPPAFSQDAHPYTLYQNMEKYGIVVWPRSAISPEMEEFFTSIGFREVHQGLAVMRFGEVNQNGTFMMPESIQKQFEIDRFIILQVLSDRIGIMVGIWEQEFGLTLPQKVYRLDEVKENIPKTLDIFREQSGKKPISWPRP
ncbi:hypothetical protein [Nitrospina watsonii]|uniref:Uncharacterized protein n=1 Tax=Nitrospina watsonii TaxID=1323948 RepID=A0ABN8W0S3_9BACT|nr:hypothetical protein [Nitrospina watsonii]CAI2718028.1 conserved protein of unknown function [Nitrospina watsonii]